MPDLGSYMSIEAWDPLWEEPALLAEPLECRSGRPRSRRSSGCRGAPLLHPNGLLLPWDRTGDRPRVAGFLLASRYEQDWAVLGWREGYNDQLACCRRGARLTLRMR